MQLTQRHVLLVMLVIFTAGILFLVIAMIIGRWDRILVGAALLSLVIMAALTVAYWRGFDQTRYAVVVFLALAVGAATPEPYVTETSSITVFLPAVVALIAAEPLWVAGSTVATLGILVARGGLASAYLDPVSMLFIVLTVGGMVLARLITDSAVRATRLSARRAEEALAEVQRQALALTAANCQQQEQLDQQRRLLELVATLETPVVSLADGVLLAPLIGHLDSRRSQQVMTRLLDVVNARRARLVILDVGGVNTVDTAVARALLHTAQALNLLGCAVTITGITSQVAMTMSSLGISLPNVKTVRSPQEALALHRAGVVAGNGAAYS